MSSIESEVTEIEDEYTKFLKELEKQISSREIVSFGFQEMSEQDLLSLLRSAMNFQRRLEYSLSSATKLFEKTGQTKRLEAIGKELIEYLNSTNEIDNTEFNYYGTIIRKVYGIVPHLKKAHTLFQKQDYEYRRQGYCAYLALKLLKPTLIEFEEEMRLIAALATYPIAKKIVLKNKLVLNGFEEVAISLEEAESNTEISHFKDAVSRCRDAVEIFIASVRKKETREETERHFATDLAKLARIEVFDEATQKLAQGVYSFLSLKGSHKYDASKVTVYDAETSLNETYSLIEMLLKKLSEYDKSQDTKKKRPEN